MKKIILEKEYSFDRSNEDVGYHYVTENLTVKIATKNVVITETVFHSIAWGANVDVTKVYFSITEFKEHKLEKVFTNPKVKTDLSFFLKELEMRGIATRIKRTSRDIK